MAFVLASYQVASRPFVGGQPISWSDALPLPIVISLFWGVLSPFILRLVRRVPLDRHHWFPALCMHIVVSSVLSLGFILVCVSVLYLIYSQSTYAADREWEVSLWKLFGVFAGITFHTSMLVYFAIVAVGQTFDFYRKIKERETLASRLQVDLVSAQLDQLRAQIHPHFLFNTLSAITTFVDKDPKTAKLMIVRLSELLRVVVDQPTVKTRRLEDELEFLRKYVEIQIVRFGDRFVFEEDIDPKTFELQIPFLLFQPLIENAINHGVCESPAVCVVRLSVQLSLDKVIINIDDTGPGQDLNLMVEGVGIGNTRSRLKHLYGNNHEFKISSNSTGFAIKITLPAQFDEEQNE